MKIIFLVRHGQTEWNEMEIFRGQADIPLNETGRKQAYSLGKELKNRLQTTPLFISSPLQRARETAAAAAEYFPGSKLLVDENFTDINFGSWQGVEKEKVKQSYPELYRQWMEEPWEASFPEGESLQEVEKRSSRALLEAAGKYEDPFVIVSHRVVNKILLCMIIGAGPSSFWKIKQDTACFNILEWDGKSLIIKTLNDTCHLKKIILEDASDF